LDAFCFIVFEKDGFVVGLEAVIVIAGFVCFFVSEEFFDVVLIEGFDVAGVVGGEAVKAFSVYNDAAGGVNGFFVAFVVPGDGLSVVTSEVLIILVAPWIVSTYDL
jgi:hypothetical protein